MDIGGKVKELRRTQNLTLRDLSDKTGLSIGFLSQFERGLTTIAVDSLQEIAKALDVPLSTLLTLSSEEEDNVIYAHTRAVSLIESNNFIHTYLSKDLSHHEMFPEEVTILPSGEENKSHEPFTHEGEEFLYVLEGILTLQLENRTTALYPGDSIHFFSKIPHNWYNTTNKVTKILVVHLPNPFKKD